MARKRGRFRVTDPAKVNALLAKLEKKPMGFKRLNADQGPQPRVGLVLFRNLPEHLRPEAKRRLDKLLRSRIIRSQQHMAAMIANAAAWTLRLDAYAKWMAERKAQGKPVYSYGQYMRYRKQVRSFRKTVLGLQSPMPRPPERNRAKRLREAEDAIEQAKLEQLNKPASRVKPATVSHLALD